MIWFIHKTHIYYIDDDDECLAYPLFDLSISAIIDVTFFLLTVICVFVSSSALRRIDQPQPTYICRHMIEAVYVPGFTIREGGRTLCLLSMSSETHTRSKFDLLINKGHGAKVIWESWTKLSGRFPDGVVSASATGHVSNLVVDVDYDY